MTSVAIVKSVGDMGAKPLKNSFSRLVAREIFALSSAIVAAVGKDRPRRLAKCAADAQTGGMIRAKIRAVTWLLPR
jgi:hypothetical protein